ELKTVSPNFSLDENGSRPLAGAFARGDWPSRGPDSERFARLVSVRRARLHSSRLGPCPMCDLEICAVAARAGSLHRLALVMSAAFMRANANVTRMNRDQLSIGMPQNEVSPGLVKYAI